MRWFLLVKQRNCLFCLILAAIFSLILSCVLPSEYPLINGLFKTKNTAPPTSLFAVSAKPSNDLISARFSNSDLRLQLLKEKVERLSKKVKKSRAIVLNNKPTFKPNYNVHIFYYAWYGSKQIDGSYKHWNHSYLPNWKRDVRRVYPTGNHEPILDIGSNFYPALGCYSSNNPVVLNNHMAQLKSAGIGVVVLSWTPQNFTDSPHKNVPQILAYAQKYKLKVALHIEPYTNRNPINMLEHLKRFFSEYYNHPALYKIKKPLGKRKVPVIYIYDSYLTPAVAWKELLSPKGNLSVRGTDFDAIFLGLLVDLQHRYHVKKSHFDGFYTYFAANSFSYGSTWKNWKNLSKFAVQNGLIFIPSVGPGYVDTQVRPWNSASTRHRRHGQYYDVAWRTAINSNTNFVSITSFNEWHEGTQIEPAISKTVPGFTYLDYEPEGSSYYLNLTKWWIEQFDKAVGHY